MGDQCLNPRKGKSQVCPTLICSDPIRGEGRILSLARKGEESKEDGAQGK
ncbi:hypothetical protein HPP92_007211 [Vanilla planifolia]|uniref:Uncharacterized protein n=1 Tax=Vanilla planifolia TaxID=51239 RepID=A0A835RHS2_VANPL|nr:hypothetical protein HPP92_007211 [Vanilla planifolia]